MPQVEAATTLTARSGSVSNTSGRSSNRDKEKVTVGSEVLSSPRDSERQDRKSGQLSSPSHSVRLDRKSGHDSQPAAKRSSIANVTGFNRRLSQHAASRRFSQHNVMGGGQTSIRKSGIRQMKTYGKDFDDIYQDFEAVALLIEEDSMLEENDAMKLSKTKRTAKINDMHALGSMLFDVLNEYHTDSTSREELQLTFGKGSDRFEKLAGLKTRMNKVLMSDENYNNVLLKKLL